MLDWALHLPVKNKLMTSKMQSIVTKVEYDKAEWCTEVILQEQQQIACCPILPYHELKHANVTISSIW